LSSGISGTVDFKLTLDTRADPVISIRQGRSRYTCCCPFHLLFFNFGRCDPCHRFGFGASTFGLGSGLDSGSSTCVSTRSSSRFCAICLISSPDRNGFQHRSAQPLHVPCRSGYCQLLRPILSSCVGDFIHYQLACDCDFFQCQVFSAHDVDKYAVACRDIPDIKKRGADSLRDCLSYRSSPSPSPMRWTILRRVPLQHEGQHSQVDKTWLRNSICKVFDKCSNQRIGYVKGFFQWKVSCYLS